MSELMKSTQRRPRSGSSSRARKQTSAISSTWARSVAAAAGKSCRSEGWRDTRRSGWAVRMAFRAPRGTISGRRGPRPVTIMPLSGSGGCVKGIVTKADRIPAAPRYRQSGAPARLAALSSRPPPRFGFDVNAKMPWPAGLSPVRKDDHAVGVKAGIVDLKRPNVPSREPGERRKPSLREKLADEVVVGPVEAETEDLIGSDTLLRFGV